MLKFIILLLSFSTFCIAETKPESAIQLIGPSGIKNLAPESGPKSDLNWPFKDGVLTVGKGHVVTTMPVTNFKAHLEFKVVNGKKSGKKNKKKRTNDGNSGVYVQQRYEIQILDSFGHDDDYQSYDCASIYKFKKPDVIACKPAGEWQSYELEFHAAKWDGDKKVVNARLTLIHNGVKVHDNVEIPDKTGNGAKETPAPLPLRLQDHGNPVQFRNFWIQELP